MATDTQSERSLVLIPSIDFAKIAFPSDKITLADIRRVHVKQFDTCGSNFFDGPKMGRGGKDWPREELSEILSIERLIARLVFESVSRGKSQSSMLNSQWEDDVELVEALSTHYERYGVTHDPQESLLLIRSIEEQAAKQAERLGASVSRPVTRQA